MADALGVDVRQSPEQLVDVQLDLEDRHGRLHLVEESGGTVDSLGNELLDQVEVDFIFLRGWLARVGWVTEGEAHAFTVGVVKGLELDNVGVSDNAHYLKFTVLQGSLD